MNIWVPHPTSEDEFNQREYGDAKFESNPDGLIYVNGKEVANTKWCPHCGGHYMPRKGQMRLKCERHNMKVCDKPFCNTYCTDEFLEVG